MKAEEDFQQERLEILKKVNKVLIGHSSGSVIQALLDILLLTAVDVEMSFPRFEYLLGKRLKGYKQLLKEKKNER